MWRRAMEYLGLNGEETYDDYDMSQEYDRPARSPRPSPGDEPGPRGRQGYPAGYEDISRPAPRPVREDSAAVRRVDDSGIQVRPIGSPRGATVRPVGGPSAEPVTVRPRQYNDAQEVADHFKVGQPVIVNLEGAEPGVSRRIVDFASGMCYALGGTMEKVANGVYLLKPAATDNF